MKKYTYQILRYMPDRVSGEFVNIGLVFFNQEEKYLKAKTIHKIGRAKHLFPSVNSRALTRKLRIISNTINELSTKSQNKHVPGSYESIKSITRSILPEDDSAIVFSPVFSGIDLVLENAFEDLYYRLILQHTQENEKHLTDKDVWSKYYKSYFDKYDYKDKLKKRAVETEGDSLQFDYAVKNGKWNYLEPVTFDLSRATNVKEKVYKWMGKLDELDSSQDTFSLYLLSVLPKDKKLRKFIKDRIVKSDADNFDVTIIEPREADKFAKKLRAELD